MAEVNSEGVVDTNSVDASALSSTVGSNINDNGATTQSSTTEKFDYQGVKTMLTELGEDFKSFSECLSNANNFMNDNINVDGNSAIYSMDGIGHKLLNQWNENAATFGDFYRTFENWSKLIVLISSNNANFEVEARSTGLSMYNGRTPLDNGSNSSGGGEDELAIFIREYGFINDGSAGWSAAYSRLTADSKAIVDNVSKEVSDFESTYGLDRTREGWESAYGSLSVYAKSCIDNKVADSLEDSEIVYDDNGFGSNGIHKDTGTRFGPDGYDVLGYNRNGFNKNGELNPEGVVKSSAGDEVVINGNNHTVYGFVEDSSGRMITLYNGSSNQCLYYFDDNGSLITVSLFDNNGQYKSIMVGDVTINTSDQFLLNATLTGNSVDSDVVYTGRNIYSD